jgi:asparagine synthase (glutamine-hydrolysing)
MPFAAFVNASQWLQIRCGYQCIYSPNPAIIDDIKKKQFVAQCWSQLYTAFACIIYDLNAQKITAVRDHFGLEPFYYCYVNGQFIFGSSLPAILKHMTPSPKINAKQLNQLFFNKWFDSETYSDETYYESVYRLEPGCELTIHLSMEGKPSHKKKYWGLKQCNQTIQYADKRDYVAHFSELLAEALAVQIGSQENIAAEFSGGLDSSAIVAAAFHNNIQPTLFMHVATPGSGVVDDMLSAQILIDKLGISDIHYIDSERFDLVSSMNDYATYFAGAAPYGGFVLAANIHQAIAEQGHHVVLSGVGGDECVSGHAPLRACVSQLVHEKGMRAVWHELNQNCQGQDSSFFDQIKCYLRGVKWVCFNSHDTLRDHEFNLLQGPGSHHLRMRIEYSAVLAKAIGFHYVYPLLYPPLVEFCYQLPLEQKRSSGVNRYLIRKFLAQFFPSQLYAKKEKLGNVTPATLEKTQRLYNAGTYRDVFHDLPFQTQRNYIQKRSKIGQTYPFLQDMPAYMFKAYWDRLASSITRNSK